LAKPSSAIANEESRYTLNGALMVLKPESITMVATDGHRLAHVERPGEKFEGISGEMKTLVPKKAMNELRILLDASDSDHVEFAERRLHALLPHWPAPSHLSPAYRPVPQLRGGSAQGQQQVHHRQSRGLLFRHPARSPVRRRALRCNSA